MSIDRYLNIVHGAHYRPFRKPKYVLLTCLLIWAGEKSGRRRKPTSRLHCSLVSIMFVFPYDYLRDLIDAKNNHTSAASDCIEKADDSPFWSCLLMFISYYVLPLLIIGVCCLLISLHTRRSDDTLARRWVSEATANLMSRWLTTCRFSSWVLSVHLSS